MLKCPYCGSKDLEYRGVDGGCGDYGDELADIFHCLNCRATVEMTESDWPLEDEEDNEVDSL